MDEELKVKWICGWETTTDGKEYIYLCGENGATGDIEVIEEKDDGE